jgi:hypothetical protein
LFLCFFVIHAWGRETEEVTDMPYKDGTYSGKVDHFLIFQRPIGEGTMVYKNGDKYVGFWKDGERDGRGTMASTLT